MKHPVFNGQPILKLEQNRMEDIKSYLGFGFYVLSPTPEKKKERKKPGPIEKFLIPGLGQEIQSVFSTHRFHIHRCDYSKKKI